VAHRVVFVGFRTNVEQYVGASDVMVLSSEREGLPVALLEGFALGRPAVATAVGSVRRIVREGETGWLVPPHDPAALGEAMLVAGRSPDEARRRGAEGYALVLREYSATTMMDRIEQVLTEALSPLRLRPAPYYAVKAAYRRRRIDRFRRARPHASPEWQGVRILAYHRVSDDDDPLAVSARDFEAHLDVILRHGIETVPLTDAVERLERGRRGARPLHHVRRRLPRQPQGRRAAPGPPRAARHRLHREPDPRQPRGVLLVRHAAARHDARRRPPADRRGAHRRPAAHAHAPRPAAARRRHGPSGDQRLQGGARGDARATDDDLLLPRRGCTDRARSRWSGRRTTGPP
jgi:hypothetical protein